MYSVFFSVSSADIAFAEGVWQIFPDDWVYLYSKTGRHGARMWDEIAFDELPKARAFVVFWSKHYPLSSGCVKEIIQASALYQSGGVKPIILRLDDYPLHWAEGLDPAAKPVFAALKPMLDYRASDPDVSVEKAKMLIAAETEVLLQSDHPRMPRHDLVQALRGTLQKDRFTLYPACWVSGFNGVGRESLLRVSYRDFAPNGRGFVVEVNEATLPQQLLLRLESEAFGADHARLQRIAAQTEIDDVVSVAQAIERISASGNFVVLRHGRIVQQEVELPDWLDDVASLLRPSTRPKLFILSQMPLAIERALRCKEFLVPFRVPTLEEQQSQDFCYKLIGHFDRNPMRWQDEDVARVNRVSGGNIGFLVSLFRSAARMSDFDNIDVMLAHENAKMAQAITSYVLWAFSQLSNHQDDQKTLLFLNDVSPCHIADLEKAVAPQRSIVRVLGRLIDLGLVERETDEIYRLTPLLANRLSRDLVRPDLVRWAEEAQRSFASRPFEAEVNSTEEGHEFIRLEARIQAALLSGVESLPDGIRSFISASHWFQAGIRLYHARKWKSAYGLLKKAHEVRQQFRDVSRVEIERYFCLVATRMRYYSESEGCITRLSNDHRSMPIAAFLQADVHEYRREFNDAVGQYERALSLNRGKERRMEFIFRPLVRCILSSKYPDFSKAESVAKNYVSLRRTIFSLSSLARVYLQWKHKGIEVGREVPRNIDKLYGDALSEVERHPGAGAAPFELYAEEAEFTGDLDKALGNMDDAIRVDPNRFQLRAERWRIMAKSGNHLVASQALRELDLAKVDSAFAPVWPAYIVTLAETYARSLHLVGRPVSLVNAFAPELQKGGELGRIISRIHRGNARD